MNYDLSSLDEECVPYQCAEHTGIGGGMYVHNEDLAQVAHWRKVNGDRPIECENCDMTYRVGKGWTS
jgi:hypothetical protein